MSQAVEGSLTGVIVVNTRPIADGAELTDLLRLRGAEVIEFPVMELRARDLLPISKLLAAILPEVLLVFTSANTLRFLAKLLKEHLPTVSYNVAVIGQKTAKLAREQGLNVIFEGRGEESGIFADELISFLDSQPFPRKLVLLRGSAASEVLPQRLRAAGIAFENVQVYDSRPISGGVDQATALLSRLAEAPSEHLQDEPQFFLTFASSLTAQYFVSFVPDGSRPQILSIPAIVIGPKTADTCRALGFTKVFVSDSPSSLSLVNLISEVRTAAGLKNSGMAPNFPKGP